MCDAEADAAFQRRQDIWRDARSKIEHEDGLVNNRLGWMLAFNGFLYAAYIGLYVFQSQGTPILDAVCVSLPGCEVKPDNRSEILRLGIASVGFLSCLFTQMGVYAAFLAVQSIVRNTTQALHMPINVPGAMARDMETYQTGFYSPIWARRFGMLCAIGLCSVVALPWLVLCIEAGVMSLSKADWFCRHFGALCGPGDAIGFAAAAGFLVSAGFLWFLLHALGYDRIEREQPGSAQDMPAITGAAPQVGDMGEDP